jgi:hypothetical protein
MSRYKVTERKVCSSKSDVAIDHHNSGLLIGNATEKSKKKNERKMEPNLLRSAENHNALHSL